MVVHPAYSEKQQQSPVLAAGASHKKPPPPHSSDRSTTRVDGVSEEQIADENNKNRASTSNIEAACTGKGIPPSCAEPMPPPPSPAGETAGEISFSDLAADQWCERNSTALLEACCNRDLTKASKILQQSSEDQVGSKRMKQLVCARDDFRDSALHLASGQGEADIVRILLAKGADVNAENNLGSTPLNRAAIAGSAEVRFFLVCSKHQS